MGKKITKDDIIQNRFEKENRVTNYPTSSESMVLLPLYIVHLQVIVSLWGHPIKLERYRED